MKFVDESKCSQPDKPDATPRECNEGTCPDVYSWAAKVAPCSTSCGQGVLKISQNCVRERGNQVVQSILCDASLRPAGRSEPCHLGDCPAVYSWKLKYSACTVTCGKGVQTVDLICNKFYLGKHSTVPSKECSSIERPEAESKECYEGECPPSYSWKSEFSQCSVTCGEGYKVLLIRCVRDLDGETMASDSCDHTTKPSAEHTSCRRDPCETPAPPSPKTDASLPETNPPIPDKLFTMAPRPTNPASEAPPKPPISRIVVSKKVNPKTRKVITIPPKPETFYWKATYGACSEVCGQGYHQMTLQCANRITDKIVSHLDCDGVKRPAQKTCQDKSCAPTHKFTGLPPSYALGCYNDHMTSRRVPVFLKSYRGSSLFDWNNMLPTIEQCAQLAHKSGYKYFAIQFYGECWAGDASVANTYDTAEASTNCFSGTGASGVNFVYKFITKDAPTPPPALVDVGCYNEARPQLFPTLVHDMRASGLTYSTIIMRCGRQASGKSYNVIGIGNKGECYGGVDVDYKLGGSRDEGCDAGIGKRGAYSVYLVETE